jgi:hypothetical protein
LHQNQPGVKQSGNQYTDLNYLPEDASAMMIQASKNNQVSGITVIEVPAKDGTCHGTTILINNRLTGFATLLNSFSEMLVKQKYDWRHEYHTPSNYHSCPSSSL